MKTMMVVALVAMVGCAGNTDALKARVESAEAKQAQLHDQIEQLKNDADTCVGAMAKVRSVEAYIAEQADKAWEAVKTKEASTAPRVKSAVSDGIDSIEVMVKDGATKAADQASSWAKQHNFTK